LQIIEEYKKVPDSYQTLSAAEKTKFEEMQEKQIVKIKTHMAK
jgi:hypothetical protein